MLEWLNFCRSIGWKATDTPALVDLWWKYHDEETGELIETPTTRSRQE